MIHKKRDWLVKENEVKYTKLKPERKNENEAIKGKELKIGNKKVYSNYIKRDVHV